MDDEQGFWAKFKYGGRSAHYFRSHANSAFTLCGRMRMVEKVSVYDEGNLKNRRCGACETLRRKLTEQPK